MSEVYLYTSLKFLTSDAFRHDELLVEFVMRESNLNVILRDLFFFPCGYIVRGVSRG